MLKPLLPASSAGRHKANEGFVGEFEAKLSGHSRRNFTCTEVYVQLTTRYLIGMSKFTHLQTRRTFRKKQQQP